MPIIVESESASQERPWTILDFDVTPVHIYFSLNEVKDVFISFSAHSSEYNSVKYKTISEKFST